MSVPKIRKAIVPVAGMATRFLPATKAQPKTMLPLVDKPVIQYIVEEAVAAGIEQVIFVTSSNQHAIQDHFDGNFELESRLKDRGKLKDLEAVVRLTGLAKFVFTRQPVPRGDGDAILMAREIVGREPVLVMFGDDVFDAPVPAARQMTEAYERYGSPVVALYDVGRENAHKYGVAGGEMAEGSVMDIREYVEKPASGREPSGFAGVGRYVVTPELMDVLSERITGADGEVRLVDATTAYLQRGLGRVYGRVIEGRRYDCGDKTDFMRAAVDFALKHEDANAGGAFAEFIRRRAAEL